MFNTDGKLNRRGKHDLGEYVHTNLKPDFDKNDTTTYNYPYNMKLVADSMQCPLIDMTTLTAGLVNDFGLDNSTRIIFNLPKDGTHFGASGSVLKSRGHLPGNESYQRIRHLLSGRRWENRNTFRIGKQRADIIL